MVRGRAGVQGDQAEQRLMPARGGKPTFDGWCTRCWPHFEVQKNTARSRIRSLERSPRSIQSAAGSSGTTCSGGTAPSVLDVHRWSSRTTTSVVLNGLAKYSSAPAANALPMNSAPPCPVSTITGTSASLKSARTSLNNSKPLVSGNVWSRRIAAGTNSASCKIAWLPS